MKCNESTFCRQCDFIDFRMLKFNYPRLNPKKKESKNIIYGPHDWPNWIDVRFEIAITSDSFKQNNSIIRRETNDRTRFAAAKLASGIACAPRSAERSKSPVSLVVGPFVSRDIESRAHFVPLPSRKLNIKNNQTRTGCGRVVSIMNI